MKISHRPIRATIIFGMICGLSFVPVYLALSYITSWSNAICLTVWLFLAGYAFLLSRLSKKSFLAIVFPLLLLFMAIFIVESVTYFFLFALAIISWIRSGICFQKLGAPKIGVELIVTLGGAMLVFIFTPYRTMEWAVGIWLFFLVQSLYFLLSGITDSGASDFNEIDPFDRAKKTAEDILSGS